MNIDELKQFIEDELSFHQEYETPKWFKLICKIFRKRTPNEVVIKELKTIIRMIEEG